MEGEIEHNNKYRGLDIDKMCGFTTTASCGIEAGTLVACHDNEPIGIAMDSAKKDGTVQVVMRGAYELDMPVARKYAASHLLDDDDDDDCDCDCGGCGCCE